MAIGDAGALDLNNYVNYPEDIFQELHAILQSGVITSIVYVNTSESLAGAYPSSVEVTSAQTAFRITQKGSGYALVIEDSNSPDVSPFIVDANGNLGLGGVPLSKFHILDGNINVTNAAGQAAFIRLAGNGGSATEGSSTSLWVGQDLNGDAILKNEGIGLFALGVGATLPVVIEAGGKILLGPTAEANAGQNVSTADVEISGKVYASGGTLIRSVFLTTSASITPSSADSDQYNITGLSEPATINPPSGTPINGQRLTIRIKDDGTARALTWVTTSGGYRVIGTTLPNNTIATKTTYVGCIYNSTDLFWDVIAVATQA